MTRGITVDLSTTVQKIGLVQLMLEVQTRYQVSPQRWPTSRSLKRMEKIPDPDLNLVHGPILSQTTNRANINMQMMKRKVTSGQELIDTNPESLDLRLSGAVCRGQMMWERLLRIQEKSMAARIQFPT